MLKWITIGIPWLSMLASIVGGLRGAEIFVVATAAATVSLVIYVTWGWFEHTLRLLIEIALNTAGAASSAPAVTSTRVAAAPEPGAWKLVLIVFAATVIFVGLLAWALLALS